MQILKIERDKELSRVYNVTFRQRTLFHGIQTFTKSYKLSPDHMLDVYYTPDGYELEWDHWIAKAITRFRKSW